MSGKDLPVAEIAEMRRRIDEARRIEQEILGSEKEYEQEDKTGISPKFVAECFRYNERGDGMLFAKIFHNRFVYVKKVGMWLYWAGNHWRYDEEDRVIDAADTVAHYFEEHADRIRQILHDLKEEEGRSENVLILTELLKKYRSRINRLRSLKGAKICVEYSHRIGESSLKIFPEALDKKPTLIACKNCVVDMLTGEVVPSDPEDYIVNAVDVEWKGIDCPRPHWENFIAEIHEQDKEVIDFIHRMLGYSSTGLRTEHFYACFIGQGRNGKGTMFDTIRLILGDLAWNISSEMLLEQRNSRQSAAASPDLYSLMGRRMVIASETDQGARVSIAQVKRLTGGDWIKTRSPYDKFEINFRPTHKLLFHTNHPPHGLAKDYAISKRLLYIEYQLSFVDDPSTPNERQRDPDLPLRLEEEASGILAWLVRGAMMWKAEGGLNPPDKIKAAVDARRKDDDEVLRYVDEMIDRVAADIPLEFTACYTKFVEWYKETVNESTQYIVSKIRFSKWFSEHGFTIEKKGGKATIKGAAFKPIEGI